MKFFRNSSDHCRGWQALSLVGIVWCWLQSGWGFASYQAGWFRETALTATSTRWPSGWARSNVILWSLHPCDLWAWFASVWCVFCSFLPVLGVIPYLVDPHFNFLVERIFRFWVCLRACGPADTPKSGFSRCFVNFGKPLWGLDFNYRRGKWCDHSCLIGMISFWVAAIFDGFLQGDDEHVLTKAAGCCTSLPTGTWKILGWS